MKLSKAQQAVIDILKLYKGSYILYNSWIFKNATLYKTDGEIKIPLSTFDALRAKRLIEKAFEVDSFKKVYKLVAL